MSDFLTQLTARSFQRQTDVRPRVAARFEPLTPYTGGFTEVSAETPASSPAAPSSPPPPSPALSSHAADTMPPAVNQPPAPDSDAPAPSPQRRSESPSPSTQKAPPVIPPEPQEIIRTVRVVEHHEREIHHEPQIIERESAPSANTPPPAQPVFITPEPEPTIQPVSTPPDVSAQQSEPPEVTPPQPPPQMTPAVRDEDDTPRRTQEKSPSISVSINRVEVRAATPPKPSPVPRPAPARRTPYRPSVSLDDYLKRRGGRS